MSSFALGSLQEVPLQSAGWQHMVEIWRLNEEDDNWEIIAPFKESRLVKGAKARVMASSDGDVADALPSNNAAGEGSKDELAEKEEQTARTNNIVSLLSGVIDMTVEAD